MNVRELIEKLSELDPELPVVTAGFDETYIAPLGTIVEVLVAPNPMAGGHCADFAEADDLSLNERSAGVFRAVKVDR